MPTNTAGQFSSDIEQFIQDETLPLARRQLVAYQFGDPLRLPKGRGTTYLATRFNRVPLPFAPLSEGVPPQSNTMTIAQVSATVQEWGGLITLTNVAELYIKHPIMNEACKVLALQSAETLERNTYNTLLAGTTQINYVNSRGARASLVAGDVLNPFEIDRADGALKTIGAPRFMGDEQTDTKLKADAGGAKASSNPRTQPHFAAIIHPLLAKDLRQNSQIVTAWTRSDINRYYNDEVGEYGGIRFCESNMVPSFTGFAQVNGSAGSAGSLATNSYFIQITGQDTQNQYESYVAQVSGSVSVTGPNGSISFTTPNVSGFTFNAYIGTSSSPTNLALSSSGPSTGPLAGQATQLPPNTTVVLTGVGAAQSPPAAPATGVTVYPTFIFGRGAYGQVMLDEMKISWLDKAEKSDPLNQLRMVGWHVYYGSIVLNSTFMMRIEATTAFSSSFG